MELEGNKYSSYELKYPKRITMKDICVIVSD